MIQCTKASTKNGNDKIFQKMMMMMTWRKIQSNKTQRTRTFLVGCRAHEDDTLQLTNISLATLILAIISTSNIKPKVCVCTPLNSDSDTSDIYLGDPCETKKSYFAPNTPATLSNIATHEWSYHWGMVGSTTKYLIDFKDTGSPNGDPLLILGHADNIDSQGRWLPRLPVITWLYRPIHDHKNYPIVHMNYHHAMYTTVYLLRKFKYKTKWLYHRGVFF